MQNHGPKRVYTPQSLEFWFGQLELEWEHYFTAEQLDEGHRIYRECEVRELELTDHDAIIHRRIDKRDEYAVIEWSATGLHVRSSTEDIASARALAVAGLHEIEELVADEISPLPEDQPLVTESKAEPAKKEAALTVKPIPSVKSRSAMVSGSRVTGTRKLLLSFVTTVEGLAFDAIWVGADDERTPALGDASHGEGVPAVSSSERAKLIGLAAYARKAHFVYDQKTGRYLLNSLVDVPNFLRVILPAWRKLFLVDVDENVAHLQHGAREIKVEAVAKVRSSNGMLDLHWIFRAGEHLLTDDEVRILNRSSTNPVILPRLGIVSMPTERMASIVSWQKGAAEVHHEGELAPYLIFSLFHDNRFQLTLSDDLKAWRDRILEAPKPSEDLPDWLRPYQRRGVEWLGHLAESGCHGLLADEMGLGKTLQVITLLAHRRVPGKPSLVVCPASVVPVWVEEINRFFPQLKVDVVKNGSNFESDNSECIWLASYAQLRKHADLLPEKYFGYVVLDEGQFIKNPDAKIARTCYSVRSDHRIVLTGTPLENRQLDLWSIFRFLMPGLLGTRSAFESSINTDRENTVLRLRAQLAPFILRRTKNEVAKELPPKVEMELICPLTDVQRSEYARICAEGLQRLGDDVGAAMKEKSFGFLALLTRLRQVCCDPDMLPWLKAPLSTSGKIALLVDKLAEIIDSGHKVVIFSQFVMLLERVKTALAENYPNLPCFELTGMTLDRLKPVQGFQNADGAAAMLVSLKAAGTGITLHAADYVFLLDPWWNPAVEAQAVDRVHRIGQKSTVFVYRMVTAGTIEERIEALKASKKNLFDQVVGGGSGELDLSQHFHTLHELVQLSLSESDGDGQMDDGSSDPDAAA